MVKHWNFKNISIDKLEEKNNNNKVKILIKIKLSSS